jgi:hypothetical protein
MDQVTTAPCPSCAAAAAVQAAQPLQASTYVYAIGHIDVRYPRPSIEKEMAHATGRASTAGLTDRQAFERVLSDRQNRYLARHLCWVLSVQGQETYILSPRDPADLDLLIQAVRSSPDPSDIDVVIGLRGSVAGPDVCNGLLLPVVFFDQVYSFNRDSILKAIPVPQDQDPAKFGDAAAEVFARIIQQSDNPGNTDQTRALNFLAVRDPAIYATAARAFASNASLSSVAVNASPLSGARNIVDVILTFTYRTSGVEEKWFARVDVTEEFPYLVTKMSPYYDR